ncbi:hypothetical protein [Oceanobacillus locisalsi]|uniref:Phr family secreted Rap phosphatase inhibitor n=1 Tax=Oceanobacillus locisalsi TaxID=546107 RepID=A0ABW3NL72_9BACI
MKKMNKNLSNMFLAGVLSLGLFTTFVNVQQDHNKFAENDIPGHHSDDNLDTYDIPGHHMLNN